jgi:hypothetical protein
VRVPARVKLLTILALPVLALPLLSGAGAGAGQSLRYADVSMPETLAGAQDAPPAPRQPRCHPTRPIAPIRSICRWMACAAPPSGCW